MTVALIAVGIVLGSVVGAPFLAWLAEKIWATLASRRSPRRRGRAQGTMSAPVPWSQLALRALAFASYASMGVYIPAAGWEDDNPACVLEDSQVVMAMIEGETLVVDCLVPDERMPSGDRRPRVPFTLRARLPCSTASRSLPPSLSRWAETGAVVDIWIGQRGGVSLVRLTGPGPQLVLELRPLVTISVRPGARS